MRRGQRQIVVMSAALAVLTAASFARTTRHHAPSFSNKAKSQNREQAKPMSAGQASAKSLDTNAVQSQSIALEAHVTAQGICSNDSFARQILLEALSNQYRGQYRATLEVLSNNFSTGEDSLSGPIEFSDEIGQRKICLAGSNQSIEYQTSRFGKEQWVTDESSQRIRRIANRQWKKGLFGNLLTYEDMLKWPSEFFLDFNSSSAIKSSDSTYEFTMVMKPLIQSFYSKLDVTFSKKPVLLKSMTFYGMQGQKLKTMEIHNYEKSEGKWLAANMSITSCDSLANLKMCFKHFSFSNAMTAGGAMPEMENSKPNFRLYSKSIKDTTLNKNLESTEESEEDPLKEVSN